MGGKTVISTPFRDTQFQNIRNMGKRYQSRRTCNKQEKNESRIRQSVVPIVTMRANWRLPKSGSRKAMGKGSEYPT